MKTLYVDCGMGAAGDMLAAALLELTPDPDASVAMLNAMGVPGVAYAREVTSRGGIAATRLVVAVHGDEECSHHHGHDHHEHAHDHHHVHRSLDDMLRIVDGLALPESTKKDAAAVYRLIAEAEGKAHGRPAGEVHFHEVGAMDAVADIAAVCRLLHEIGPVEVVASPVNLGGGTVRCAHGVLPVPAPATAALLEGLPSYGDENVRLELCTPTGAALLRHFAKRFGPQPPMRTTRTGCGAGSREVEGRANMVRCFLGEGNGAVDDEVVEIACNIDDMTGEDIAFACESLFAAGAVDVTTVPATMKKGRPGVILLVLCRQERRDAVMDALFRHTTTLGARERLCRRAVLPRREDVISLSDGLSVRRKTCTTPGGERSKLEHDDLAAFARAKGISLLEARNLCDTPTSIR